LGGGLMMNIEQMKLADIIPYAGNAKKHDDRQIKNVMESIKQFGFAH
jgi:ParB-like chromosome segregation protein Spo0J